MRILKTHMPDKADRYGIKAYLVFESKSSCICNMEVCTGKLQLVKDIVFTGSG